MSLSSRGSTDFIFNFPCKLSFNTSAFYHMFSTHVAVTFAMIN
jgi:hypothetical protein